MVCNSWSNISVTVGKPLVYGLTVSRKQLAYDCRLIHALASSSREHVIQFSDWLVEGGAAFGW